MSSERHLGDAPPTVRGVGLAALAALVLLALAVVVLTPWRPLPAGAPPVVPDLAGSFTARQVARAEDYRRSIGGWPYVSIIATLATLWGLWAAARHRRWPGRGRGPVWAALAVLGATLAARLVGLPAAAHAEQVRRRFGLSTNTWPGWLRDQLVSWAISAGVLVLAILAALWVLRRVARSWPWVLASGAVALTVGGSLLYPVVVEPSFNTFRPLQAGPLRERIVALGEADGLGRVEVLVSNASIRTTGENAHVSGLGATHRVVLDDTTLARAQRDPDAVLSVIAHEFGHVVHHDVARGTTVGACAAAAAALAGSWLLLHRRRGHPPLDADRGATVRAALLGVALAATLPYLAAPVENVMSRRVEAAADVHALDLTRDPESFIRMQQSLATTNLSRLTPTWWQTVFFSTHPDPVWRIAQARAWEAVERR
jgi:STE24 endopeptidase